MASGTIIALLLVVLMTVLIATYLITSLIYGLWLKKSNIKNWGLAFVPIVSTYKMFHYVLDVYLLRKAGILNESEELLVTDLNKYISNFNEDGLTYEEYRRKMSFRLILIVLLALIVLQILFSLITSGLEEGAFVSTLDYIPSLIITGLISYGVYSTVSKVERGKVTLNLYSNNKILLYTFISLLTGGLSLLVTMVIYITNKKYRYILDNISNCDTVVDKYKDNLEVVEVKETKPNNVVE